MSEVVFQKTSVLITAPTLDVMTLAELKTALAITSDTQDDLLEALRDAVTQTLDPASGGWLGRALRPQTWELRLSQFPYAAGIDLPFPIHTEITSVKYDDMNGDEHTLIEGTDYRVFNLDQRTRACVVPLYLQFWPIARPDRESVRIRYVAGYAGDAIPQPIKSAVALAVKDLLNTSERNLFQSLETIPGVRERRWIVSPAAGEVIQRAIGNLLSVYRVWN